MMTSDDKVGGWVKKGQNHDDVILECPLIQCTLITHMPVLNQGPTVLNFFVVTFPCHTKAQVTIWYEQEIKVSRYIRSLSFFNKKSWSWDTVHNASSFGSEPIFIKHRKNASNVNKIRWNRSIEDLTPILIGIK